MNDKPHNPIQLSVTNNCKYKGIYDYNINTTAIHYENPVDQYKNPWQTKPDTRLFIFAVVRYPSGIHRVQKVPIDDCYMTNSESYICRTNNNGWPCFRNKNHAEFEARSKNIREFELATSKLNQARKKLDIISTFVQKTYKRHTKDIQRSI